MRSWALVGGPQFLGGNFRAALHPAPRSSGHEHSPLTEEPAALSWHWSPSREVQGQPDSIQGPGGGGGGEAEAILAGRSLLEPWTHTVWMCVETAFIRNISLTAKEMRQAVSLGEAEARGK